MLAERKRKYNDALELEYQRQAEQKKQQEILDKQQTELLKQ